MTQKLIFLLAIILFVACQDDDAQFGDLVAPTNLQIDVDIENATEEAPFGDGSGRVHFTATADNAISFKFDFGDNITRLAPGGGVTHTYTMVGTNDYLVTVTASGRGGLITTETILITVLSEFEDPLTRSLLTGDDTKTWSIAANVQGHLGVGPLDTYTPDFFAAAPNQLAPCLYDDVITFTLDGGSITFDHDNAGETFFNAEFTSVGGGGGDEDQCLPFDTEGTRIASLAASSFDTPEELTTGTQFTISDEGFMSYYINTSTYEILEISETFMHVRAISGSVNNPLAWYFKFTTEDPAGPGTELESEFDQLVWAEEFDVDGPPNPDVWNFEIGNGVDGWGNLESQYYTEENAVVSDGTLKIDLIAEPINGFNYSSSRMTTLDKFDFQYGRIDIRAKLPEGGGTWPALWMMGVDFPTAGWPFCGEIDIMEHRGNQQDVIHGSLHFPGNSGGDAVTQTTDVPGVSEEFFIYTVEWTEEHIIFAVNNQIYHVFPNNPSLPYNQPFFLLLNVAMGGTFGGDVDPDFERSTMEVDYIRVFQ